VFGPGHITAHRVRRGDCALSLDCYRFAYLYQVIAEVIPAAFSGLTFRGADRIALSPFLYYSLMSLTTLGLGDITPVHELARSFTVLEALLGQLFPAVILARILTLYSDEGKRSVERGAIIATNSVRTGLDP
jgi:hypothetical protein